ncbi:MAG: tRNA uridine-5-carboxymethylaminomethyl(34) synthesis GTPase MnmE [Alloprevotella sp.]
MSTICAIATPSGGALGVIRVSGPQAIQATSAIFQPAGPTPLHAKKGNTLSFGCITDPDTHETIDEVLVSLFRAPHSYTGEDSTEISCHGSAYILQRVLQLLLTQGCTMARPGEYTQRAFMNGKMDLSQAEAVADLIASTTAANHRMAMSQMRGSFSKELRTLRDQLLHITALLELELDFSDHEDLEFADRTELQDLAGRILHRITQLCNSFRLGNALKRGVPVAIVGETNAGKSTLLNALVGEERALVSHIHGTTRDTVEESITVGDTLIRFIDTAGIRATTDTVEQMGIERTFAKISEAEIVLWLIDSTQALSQFEALRDRLLPACTEKSCLLLLFNKADLLTPDGHTALQQAIDEHIFPTLTACDVPFSTRILSAQSSADIVQLRQLLTLRLHELQQAAGSAGDVIVSNLRHYEALSQAQASIQRVIDALHTDLSGDFISQDLRECIHHLSDIVGEVTPESVLHTLFQHFCIGK